jgi:hypothetical protein
MIDRLMTRFSPRIDQHADLGFQHPPDRIEQPTMRVDLLLVVLFQYKDDLDGDEVVGVSRVRLDELRFGVDRDLGGILCVCLCVCWHQSSLKTPNFNYRPSRLTSKI